MVRSSTLQSEFLLGELEMLYTRTNSGPLSKSINIKILKWLGNVLRMKETIFGSKEPFSGDGGQRSQKSSPK